MKTDRLYSTVIIAGALLLLTAGMSWSAAPQAVSPGATDRFVQVSDRCPTFSWGAESGRSHYEIVAYVLADHLQVENLKDADLGEWNQALYVTVSGTAGSWTPPMELSLQRGQRYVWFVRGVSLDDEGALVDAGIWSKASFFEIPAELGEQELQQTLEMMQQLMVESSINMASSSTAAAGRDHGQEMPANGKSAVSSAKRAVPSAPAAIKGSLPTAAGEVYGIVGSSASADGAGLAAVNTNNGADLVLDGSEDSSADTEFRESGISRDAATDQSFAISNPGAGDITLDVNGDIEVVDVDASGVFTGDGSGLTNLSYTEIDPEYSADPASGITATNITNWNSAYGWGDHSTVGYLTSYTETDPVYTGDPAAGITSPNIANWNTAFGWGNHAAAGYDTTDDSWVNNAAGTHVTTQNLVGIGTGTPGFDLNVFGNNVVTGLPQLWIDQAGVGDAFQKFTRGGTTSVTSHFSVGIDALDSNFKIVNQEYLTAGAGSAQGDGITVMQSDPRNIVSINNQSRARAVLMDYPQGIPFAIWTPVEFNDDFTLPFGYDQQNEFAVSAGPGAPAFFVATVDGFYQVNSRIEFNFQIPEQAIPGGYVSIAIATMGVLHSEGNNLQMVSATGEILMSNNAPNVSDVLFLTAGQVVEIWAWQSIDLGIVPLAPSSFAGDPAPLGKVYVSIHKIS